MTEQWNDYALQKECEEIARDIFDSYVDNYDCANEEIDPWNNDMYDETHERVDGHQWVIYHYKALRICAECDIENGEAFLEDTGMPNEVTLHTLASTILYGEMVHRIREACEELVEAHNEALT